MGKGEIVGLAGDQIPLLEAAFVQVIGMEQAGGVFADHLGDRIAGDRLPRRVEKLPAPGRVGSKNHLAHIGQHRLRQVASFLKLTLQPALDFDRHRGRDAHREAGREEQLKCQQLRGQATVDKVDGTVAERGCDRCNQGDLDQQYGGPEQSKARGMEQHHWHHQEQDRQAGLGEHGK